MIETQNSSLRIEEGRTKLTVTYNGKNLTFLYPAYGPASYTIIEKVIRDEETIEGRILRIPTMAETASLVYAAFNSDDRFSQRIRNLLKSPFSSVFNDSYGLWTSTAVLYVLRKKPTGYYIAGSYIQDDRKYIEYNGPHMVESELIKMLESRDPSVRFVPSGYKTGHMTYSELGRDSFVRGLAGMEGAEKLSKVAYKLKHKPRLINSINLNPPPTGFLGFVPSPESQTRNLSTLTAGTERTEFSEHVSDALIINSDALIINCRDTDKNSHYAFAIQEDKSSQSYQRRQERKARLAEDSGLPPPIGGITR